jgi:hypothetical protein
MREAYASCAETPVLLWLLSGAADSTQLPHHTTLHA